ncbi:hypothetical protein NITHO_2960009 [Nitrolancea hollandica Lb]|uniref:Uncharacterized protein n=1 Tax=Nitrolancea hollandica Lb TaxID=1129897 RepID=I4EH25_9BACT|nr:hypothetical protein NITHO_2960009 [Nitrolancea hollandica Lb]
MVIHFDLCPDTALKQPLLLTGHPVGDMDGAMAEVRHLGPVLFFLSSASFNRSIRHA